MVKNPSANAGGTRDSEFNPWVEKIPWSRKWQSIPVFLPGKFHGQRNLVCYSPWGRKESDTTELSTVSGTYMMKLMIATSEFLEGVLN